MKITRRTFLGALGSATLAGVVRPVLAFAPIPKRIAIITTVWTYQSHAQHMGDRFLVGYPRHGAGEAAAGRLTLSIEAGRSQPPARRRSRHHASDHREQRRAKHWRLMRLIIGEHGDYPRNHSGQILIHASSSSKVVRVFEQTGAPARLQRRRLSYSWKKRARWSRIQALRFPFLAGSSLPATWRLPP
jgi:hypothetical protein